jgi:hypothetical protein
LAAELTAYLLQVRPESNRGNTLRQLLEP